jgi:pyridoxamine 5'-phosphate oxidase
VEGAEVVERSLDVPDGERPLEPEDLGNDPVAAFREWWDQARNAGLDQADAMALATTSAEQGPSVRMVLLREFDERGFVFHSNRQSRKGADLLADARAGLAFHWTRPLHRQVRAEGRMEPLETDLSEAYFQGRPAGARISAWASPQSQVVADRADLERRWQEVRARFPDYQAIPLPPFWGGYRLVPESLEFWQGRRDRLHDRIRFRRQGAGWVAERLAP